MNDLNPIATLPGPVCKDLAAVFTDIDDTLTTHGRVGAEAYAALGALKAAGLLVIPITGRPAGWCDMIARAWPVDAVVGENGAFYFRYDEATRRMRRGYADPETLRAHNRDKLGRLGRDILASVPGAGISADQAYREADLAIDFCEDVPRLPDADIERIAAMFRAAGATAKISSIHVNGWFGTYDKLTMTRRLMGEVFGVDIDRDRQRCVFIGDSPNDAPMFAHFPFAVGVANVLDFKDRCEALPAYVTQQPYGAGFAELTRHILAGRASR